MTPPISKLEATRYEDDYHVQAGKGKAQDVNAATCDIADLVTCWIQDEGDATGILSHFIIRVDVIYYVI